MKFQIERQWYPTVTGERPLSYAIYLRRRLRKVFIGYSWSPEGALKAIEELSKWVN